MADMQAQSHAALVGNGRCITQTSCCDHLLQATAVVTAAACLLTAAFYNMLLRVDPDMLQ